MIESAGLLIIQDNKILLAHPTNAPWYGSYTIPKGKVEDGETYIDTAIRETKEERYAEIKITASDISPKPKEVPLTVQEQETIDILIAEMERIQTQLNDAQNLAQNCVMTERGTSETAILNGFKSVSGNYYYPVFHSQTPEDFHKRLTFLQQCTRQGAAKKYNAEVDTNGILRARNSVFGRQPICILRIGDFFYTKIVIETVTIDYADTTWDMNPEGFGMQPMMAKITLQVKIIGGQSLRGPIDALQNAVAFNYYANSTFTDKGMYELPSRVADSQASYIEGIQTKERDKLISDYNNKVTNDVNKARMKELNLSDRIQIKK